MIINKERYLNKSRSEEYELLNKRAKELIKENEDLRYQVDKCIRELNKQYELVDSILRKDKVTEDGIKFKESHKEPIFDNIPEFEVEEELECNNNCYPFGLDCLYFHPSDIKPLLINLEDIPKDMTVDEYINQYIIPTLGQSEDRAIINAVADTIQIVSTSDEKLDREASIKIAIELFNFIIEEYKED